MTGQAQYSIAELAELGGVSRRTVRYYVQRGLIPTPTGTGRGSHYTQEHLDTLVSVRELQASGVGLDEIARRLQGDGPQGDGPRTQPAPTAVRPRSEQTPWLRVRVADGVELHLRQGQGLDAATLLRLETAVREALSPNDSAERGGEES